MKEVTTPIIEGDFPDFNLPFEERCLYCGRKATRLCDADVGIIFDALNDTGTYKVPAQKTKCSTSMCDKCTTRFGDLDFCKEHKEELRKIIKENKESD